MTRCGTRPRHSFLSLPSPWAMRIMHIHATHTRIRDSRRAGSPSSVGLEPHRFATLFPRALLVRLCFSFHPLPRCTLALCTHLSDLTLGDYSHQLKLTTRFARARLMQPGYYLFPLVCPLTPSPTNTRTNKQTNNTSNLHQALAFPRDMRYSI